MSSDAGSYKQKRLADRAIAVSFWQQFEELFPTEQACIEWLNQSFAENQLVNNCHFCNSAKTERVDLRAFKCLDCKRCSFFTAGTFFERIRLIKAWLGAIWLLENGVNFTGCHFAELAGIAKSTASGIVKKLALVIYRTMDDSEETLNSSEFARIFIRRSLYTPALEHPRAEQKLAEEEYLANSPEAQIAAHNALLGKLSQIERVIYHELKLLPQSLDNLQLKLNVSTRVISAAVTSIELLGLIDRLDGDNYICPERKIFVPSTAAETGCPVELEVLSHSVVSYIQSSMHGISRKYLQLYVVKYLCFKDRAKWGLDSIFAACRRSKPVYLSEIKAFVTPLFVKVGRLSEAA